MEALKPKMLDWSLTQIVGAPELLGIVLNNRTDVNKVGGAKRPASDAGLVQKKRKRKSLCNFIYHHLGPVHSDTHSFVPGGHAASLNRKYHPGEDTNDNFG